MVSVLIVGKLLAIGGRARLAVTVSLVAALCLQFLAVPAVASPQRTGHPGGALKARGGGDLRLSNQFIAVSWRVERGRLRAVNVEDRLSRRIVTLPESAFTIFLKDATEIKSAEMRVVGTHRVEVLQGWRSTSAVRLTDRNL